MRAALSMVVVVGCGFTAPAGQGRPGDQGDAPPQADAPPADAPPLGGDAAVDAAPDGHMDAPMMAATCHVGLTSTAGTDRGQVGGNGGTANPTALACTSANDRIIGIAVRMSNQNTTNGGRSAYAMQIQCASVTITDTGVDVGTPYTREVAGNGMFMWTPATLSTMTTCQPGWFVSGIHAHRGSSDDLFVDVTIQCTQLDSAGQAGATELIYVMGSLTNTANADAVDCAADEVLARLPNRTGAGLDAVNLSCSKPTCL